MAPRGRGTVNEHFDEWEPAPDGMEIDGAKVRQYRFHERPDGKYDMEVQYHDGSTWAYYDVQFTPKKLSENEESVYMEPANLVYKRSTK